MKNLKRFLTLFLALSMVLSALSMTAFAAAGDPGTIKEVEIEADYDGVVTTDAEDGDVNFALNYSEATENGMYLVLVLSEEGVPKNGNILYVNQETADGEGVTFDNVYPMEIGEENSYIYMAGTDLGYDKVGTIIPNVEEVTGMKGDVDLDNDVDMTDAIMLLRHYLGIEVITDATSLDNGEVTGNGTIEMQDCIKILRYYLGIITTLD